MARRHPRIGTGGRATTKARLRELMDMASAKAVETFDAIVAGSHRAAARGYRQVQMVRLSRHLPCGDRGRDRASGSAVNPNPRETDRRTTARWNEAGRTCAWWRARLGQNARLIERFAWLVEHQGVDAGRILAITFTEKAATEIKQRLMDRFVESGRLARTD